MVSVTFEKALIVTLSLLIFLPSADFSKEAGALREGLTSENIHSSSGIHGAVSTRMGL